MNRITAILLAMAALLIHVLAVHRNGFGAFGAPYESAHAAFHLGRTLVHDGSLAWSFAPGSGAVEGGLSSYPSPLLVGVSALLEWLAAIFGRGYFAVTRGAQIFGITAVLFTVFLSTRFDTDRIAGVVPALLLVTSGAVAAAGASGTEWPLVMFLLCMSFVALEHGRSRFAALGLALLVISSPVGVVATGVLAVQALLRRVLSGAAGRAPKEAQVSGLLSASAPGYVPPLPSLWAFLPAAGMLLLVESLGASLLWDLSVALECNPALTGQGLDRLMDFCVATASPALLVFPLVALGLGELSGAGRRALAAALMCAAATVALGGGAPASFGIAFTPALALAFIAIQQGMARALDTYRRGMERGVWVLMALTIVAALFASRFPGDLGQLKVKRVQDRLYQARAEPSYGGATLTARQSLYAEIRLAEQLREVGAFLRDRLPRKTTILSPWPGAIAYLTRMRVVDVFGRTTPLPGKVRQLWSLNPPPIDLLGALGTEPDYVLPSVRSIPVARNLQLADMFPERFLKSLPEEARVLRSSVEARLARYDIVVTTGQSVDDKGAAIPLVLLRKRGLQDPPVIGTRRKEGFLEVFACFEGAASLAQVEVDEERVRTHVKASGQPLVRALPQVFDADISLQRRDGTRVFLNPAGDQLGSRGDGSSGPPERSITGVVIDPRWYTPVTLARIPWDCLEQDGGAFEIETRLYHHQLSGTTAVAASPLRFRFRD